MQHRNHFQFFSTFVLKAIHKQTALYKKLHNTYDYSLLWVISTLWKCSFDTRGTPSPVPEHHRTNGQQKNRDFDVFYKKYFFDPESVSLWPRGGITPPLFDPPGIIGPSISMKIEILMFSIKKMFFWPCRQTSKQTIFFSKTLLYEKENNVKIHFCPKFHCELNAIERAWCYEKQFVRKHSDQTYNTMVNLIFQSRQVFTDRNIHLKLFRRFWRALHAYSEGQTYGQVLKLFFSNSCRDIIQAHRKITNTNLRYDHWTNYVLFLRYYWFSLNSLSTA